MFSFFLRVQKLLNLKIFNIFLSIYFFLNLEKYENLFRRESNRLRFIKEKKKTSLHMLNSAS